MDTVTSVCYYLIWVLVSLPLQMWVCKKKFSEFLILHKFTISKQFFLCFNFDWNLSVFKCMVATVIENFAFLKSWKFLEKSCNSELKRIAHLTFEYKCLLSSNVTTQVYKICYITWPSSKHFQANWTPLHCAVHSAHVDCLDLLLSYQRHSANQNLYTAKMVCDVINMADKDGWTIAHLAATRESKVTHN